MTSLDNFVVLLALLLSLGAARAIGGYLLSQAIMLGAAYAVTFGTDLIAPGWAGGLGVVPIAVGLRTLWHQHRVSPDPDASSGFAKTGLWGVAILFLGLSFDSFSVMAPLLSDSLPAFRLTGLFGAALAVVGLSGLALLAIQKAAPSARWAERLEQLGPYVMILVGVYVLLNTGTDVA